MKLRVYVQEVKEIEINDEVFDKLYQAEVERCYENVEQEDYNKAIKLVEEATGIPYVDHAETAETKAFWAIGSDDFVDLVEG